MLCYNFKCGISDRSFAGQETGYHPAVDGVYGELLTFFVDRLRTTDDGMTYDIPSPTPGVLNTLTYMLTTLPPSGFRVTIEQAGASISGAPVALVPLVA